MKKKIIYIAMLAVSSLGFSSCDSELDIAKHGNLGSMEDFYTNDENTMQATSSLYLQMRSLHYDRWRFAWRQRRNGETQRIHLRHRSWHDPEPLFRTLWRHL